MKRLPKATPLLNKILYKRYVNCTEYSKYNHVRLELHQTAYNLLYIRFNLVGRSGVQMIYVHIIQPTNKDLVLRTNSVMDVYTVLQCYEDKNFVRDCLYWNFRSKESSALKVSTVPRCKVLKLNIFQRFVVLLVVIAIKMLDYP